MINCGQQGKRVCTGMLPFFLDVQPSFGFAEHWDVLVDLRFGIGTDFTTSHQFAVAPGFRYWVDPELPFKFYATIQGVFDATAQHNPMAEGQRLRRPQRERVHVRGDAQPRLLRPVRRDARLRALAAFRDRRRRRASKLEFRDVRRATEPRSKPNLLSRLHMIQVGRLGQADVDAAAGILFDAFGAAYRRRGHAPPFPTRESAAWLCRAYIDLDPEGCALARSSSEVVGVGFAHPRGAVTSIGPLASRPGAPAGVARALMNELGEIAAAFDQRPAVPGQLQPRLVRPLHAARLRGRRRRAVSARREARAAAARRRRPGVRPLVARRPARRSNATTDRAPAPIGAAISRCCASTGGGFVSRRRRAAGSRATCSFARCRRASSSARPSPSRPRSWRRWSTASRRACPAEPP